MTAPGRLLAIDHGLKRIGIAISDPLQLTARELMIIHRRSKREDFERLKALFAEHKPVALIVGMPNNPDLPEGVHSHADTVRIWIERLRAVTDLPIICGTSRCPAWTRLNWRKRDAANRANPSTILQRASSFRATSTRCGMASPVLRQR
ncbi:RuvX/YqgF family protein [Kamptonema cortianum]|nr:RuvX/YqgF family protein [Kamptonema cortianum]